MKKLSVICPTYRNPRYLDLFLKSAVEGRKLESTKIVISIDGFYGENEGILKKYKEYIDKDIIQILDLGVNRGMQTAINFAVYQTEGNPNLCIVNDDNVLNVGYDVPLSELDCTKTVYTVEQVEPDGPGMFNFIVRNFGKTEEDFKYYEFQQYARENIDYNKEWRSEAGRIFPFVISKKNYMSVGGFDTVYDSPNLCDWDFFLKLELIEIDFYRINSALFYHFCSIATKKNSESSIFRNKESKAIETFKYKWGFNPYNGINNTKIPPNCWLIK